MENTAASFIADKNTLSKNEFDTPANGLLSG
jgi:hypothetical protein